MKIANAASRIRHRVSAGVPAGGGFCACMVLGGTLHHPISGTKWYQPGLRHRGTHAPVTGQLRQEGNAMRATEAHATTMPETPSPVGRRGRLVPVLRILEELGS